MEVIKLNKDFAGIEPVAEGDGKAAVCCVGKEAMLLLSPRLEKGDDIITAAVGEEKSKILTEDMKTKPFMEAIEPLRAVERSTIAPSAEGDGKALVCCVGSKLARY